MPALGDERSVTSWMARAVYTASIDRLRADARRARHERRARSQPAEAAPDAHTVAELHERVRWLRNRIDELPEADRHVVWLRFHGDVTLDAVGASLGITGNAAHGRIRRAVGKLQDMAKEAFGDGHW